MRPGHPGRSGIVWAPFCSDISRRPGGMSFSPDMFLKDVYK